MSWVSRVRNRISPIHMNSGSAVSVQLDGAAPDRDRHRVAGRAALNSCMPIQATPDSVSPIHTPLPRIRNSATIEQRGDARCRSWRAIRCAALFAGRRCDAAAAQLEHQLVDEGDGQDHRARRHRQLRDPQRRGVVAGGDVVEGRGLPGQAAGVEGGQRGQQRRGPQRPDLERVPRPRRQRRQQQRDADVLAALERVRQRQEAGRRPSGSRRRRRCPARGSAAAG